MTALTEQNAALDDDANYIIAQLNEGLRLEWAYIDELNRSLDQMIERAEKSGNAHIPVSEKSRWNTAFSGLRSSLQVMRDFDHGSRESFNSHDHSISLDPWDSVLDKVSQLQQHLKTIEQIGSAHLPLPSQSQWTDLCTSIGLQLDTLRSHVVTVRFKLELREKYGGEHAASIVEDLAERLPAMNAAGTGEGSERDAQVRSEREKINTWEVLKALLLLPEETKK